MTPVIATPKSSALNGLFRRGLNAAFWSVAARLGGRVLRFGSNLVLTRLLAPEAFGLMAAATIVTAMVELFSDLGVKTAIVQNPRGETREFLDSAWVLSVCRGALLGAVVILCAEPAAAFFRRPDLFFVLLWLAIVPLLAGLENPATALFVKRLRPLPRFILEFGGEAIGIAASIILAFVFPDVRALMGGIVARAVFRLIASFSVCEHTPRFRIHSAAARELVSFGKFILLNTMLTWAAMNADRFVVGRALGMESLGVYGIGRNLGMMAELLLMQAVMNSYFPMQCKTDETQVPTVYKTSVYFIIPAAAFGLTILICFSREIIELFYDPRYIAATPVLAWFAARGIFRAIGVLQGSTLTARGMPGLDSIASLVGLLTLLPLLIPVFLETSFLGLSPIALVGTAITISAASMAAVQSVLLARRLRFSITFVLLPYGLAAIAAGTAWVMATVIQNTITGSTGVAAL